MWCRRTGLCRNSPCFFRRRARDSARVRHRFAAFPPFLSKHFYISPLFRQVSPLPRQDTPLRAITFFNSPCGRCRIQANLHLPHHGIPCMPTTTFPNLLGPRKRFCPFDINTPFFEGMWNHVSRSQKRQLVRDKHPVPRSIAVSWTKSLPHWRRGNRLDAGLILSLLRPVRIYAEGKGISQASRNTTVSSGPDLFSVCSVKVTSAVPAIGFRNLRRRSRNIVPIVTGFCFPELNLLTACLVRFPCFCEVTAAVSAIGSTSPPLHQYRSSLCFPEMFVS